MATATRTARIPRLTIGKGGAATAQWLDAVLPLLVLVVLELTAMGQLRRYFRRHHGG
jgi:hypothetical protein